MNELPQDFINALKRTFSGEVRTDFTSRLLYSTDASIYQIQPLGVAFPRTAEDLAAAVGLAAQHQVPVLARGAGSSLAGQAIGPALILDTSRYLTHILKVDPERRTATVEPGVLLSALNRAAATYGLTFGPDPASADRATVGGSIANNASGAHSILYGMSADHLISAEVILADGSAARFNALPLAAAEQIAAGADTLEAAWYRTALDIRQNHASEITRRWPRVYRRASGYNLNYLLPWSPAAPPQWAGTGQPGGLPYPPIAPDEINLAPLLAGSEGTLAVLRELTLNLVPLPEQTVLGVLSFDSIAEACDAVPELMERCPTAIELIPGDLIELARSVPAYARQLTFVQGTPPALLVVEFSGAEVSRLQVLAHRLRSDVLVAHTKAQQKQVWDVRKMGLGILNSRAGDAKPISFIEDLAVPVDHLGEFVREIERITVACGTRANFYAHASSGCLHIRPLINLKDAQSVAAMRAIAEQAVDLTLRLGGAVSGEHGDGLARSEWIERAYGAEIVSLFRALKTTADPQNLLNPGKILDAPAMDANLRYETGQPAQEWKTVLDFSSQGNLAGAIEMCNGAGVCRKDDGVMCPSFQATQEEMHSTRGRANLLRALIYGRFPTEKLAEEKVYQALDLCLACKGCKAECPSAVDVAKLKYEFSQQYYKSHPHRLRDYLFAYIGLLAPLATPFAPLVNALLGKQAVRDLSQRLVGLAPERQFPRFARYSRVAAARRGAAVEAPEVLFLTDTFSRYFHPETEMAGRQVLEAAGLRVRVLPIIGAGRTLISKGFLDAARHHAVQLVEAIRRMDPQGRLPVVGVEPSEIYTLADEFPDFFPGDPYVRGLAERAWMVDEFLLRPGAEGRPLLHGLSLAPLQPEASSAPAPEAAPESARSAAPDGAPGLAQEPLQTMQQPAPPYPLAPAVQTVGQVLLHGHCYQKARRPAADGFPTGLPATAAVLEAAGYRVKIIDSGCCGMAGGFGYEGEHYQVSMAVGELSLFPAVRQAEAGTIIAATGTSCRSQIADGADRNSVHPICLLANRLAL